MRLRFCGVRGSTPAPGVEFVRVGGHTSCVAVTVEGADRPTIVLDAGTGLRTVTDLVAPDPFRGAILLTHLHWDHVQGIPFFAGGDREDSRVDVFVPDGGIDAEVAVAEAMSPPNFPIGPDGLLGDWRFTSIGPGDCVVEGVDVATAEVPHKGGRTLGYRLTDASGSVAYVPDHAPAPAGPERDAALTLIDGVDLLVHGGHFTSSEASRAHAYGHGTIDEAIALAVEAGVGRLVLTHHSPARTDDELDTILASLAETPLPVDLARQGEEWGPGGR